MFISSFREMFTPSRIPPPLPPRKPPVPSDVRQSGCTHKVMTRLFDEYGATTCSVCHRHPSFGWLYRCTQNTAGFLPKSDFSDHVPKREIKMNANLSSPNLSPSVTRAINQGQYSTEQIRELLRQKESVLDAIHGDTRPTTASSASDDSTTFSAIPESTTFSTNTSASLDEEIRVAYDWQTLHKVWQAQASRQESQEQQVLSTETELESSVSTCGFRICATCRPTYRERAFQSLDQVLINPKWPPQWELDNRRISDARVVRNIGLRKHHRFYAQNNGQDIDSQHTFISQYPSSHDEAHLEGDAGEGSANRRHSRSGFRETVRNALKRARSDQPTSLDKGQNNKPTNASTESVTPFRRSMIFMRRKSRPSMILNNGSTRVVGNESLQNSLNLMIASNTPLPSSGPNTPVFPPNQPISENTDKKDKWSYDEGAIIAHA